MLKKVLIGIGVLIALVIGGVFVESYKDFKFVSEVKEWVDIRCGDKSNGVFVICKKSKQGLTFDKTGELIDGLQGFRNSRLSW